MSDQIIKHLLNDGYRYALALCQHHAMAEDILQMAWLGILKVNGPKEKGYLFRAIRNHFINQNKRHGLVPMLALGDVSEEEMFNDTNEAFLSAELSSIAMEKALNSLRVLERELIFLHYYVGYTAQEIADMLEMPRNTVLSNISRSCKKLRKYFEVDDQEVI